MPTTPGQPKIPGLMVWEIGPFPRAKENPLPAGCQGGSEPRDQNRLPGPWSLLEGGQVGPPGLKHWKDRSTYPPNRLSSVRLPLVAPDRCGALPGVSIVPRFRCPDGGVLPLGLLAHLRFGGWGGCQGGENHLLRIWLEP